MKRENRMRRILAEGKVAVGTCVDSYSPAAIEVAGYSGLDWVRVCNEYSWRRDESMEHMMRAAALAGITPMIRVEKGNPYLISKAFQCGAGAVLVSDIADPEEALAAARAAKFAPRGHRGYSGFSFAGKWGADSGKDWVEWCDQELLVGVMIENEEAVRQADRILAVEGIDFGFFGPADYSMSIGLRSSRKNDPRVQEAVRKTAEAAAKHGKALGIGIGEPYEEEAKRYLALGLRILEVDHELAILRSVYRKAGERIRALGF